MKKILRKLRGIALMESVIALFVLTIGAVSVFAMSIYSAKTSRQAEARAAALSIARTKIEDILVVSQGNRKAVTDEALDISAELKKSIPGQPITEATYSILPVTGTKNLQEIIVKVRWKNRTGHGDESSRPFSSVVASKTVSSTLNMDGQVTDGWTTKPIDQLFYTPPPPVVTSAGSTGGGTPGSTTGGIVTPPVTGGTTGGTPPIVVPPAPPKYTGFLGGYGSKWK
jgi:type II secretory pathway pseudopilin PulG